MQSDSLVFRKCVHPVGILIPSPGESSWFWELLFSLFLSEFTQIIMYMGEN